ncbi:uncharacterized protein LOC124892988 [Capsicum annuum]|uniref:uncharacterized protein LOC124892988 n=1 Tax=Capsicum annuum TaxID=4072 RepID=UPI001FB0F204|nr:uncharacterized protein LOC124892988 [Capsicum annuum]
MTAVPATNFYIKFPESNKLIQEHVLTSSSSRISVYALQVGLDRDEKKDFWEVLDEVVRSIPTIKKLFMGGDFDRHIGSLLRGYDDLHGGINFGERDYRGASLLNFSRAFGLWIAKSSFPKKEEHLIIFRSSVAKS